MKFTWIQTEKATYSVAKLCRWLDVTRSGFYAWRARPESMHTRDDRRLKVLVRASFAASKQRYGSPRIHEDLIEQDEHVSRKRVVRLMQEDRLKARLRKRYKPGFPISPWYRTHRINRRVLSLQGSDVRSRTTEGDTWWVKKKTVRFSSHSTAC